MIKLDAVVVGAGFGGLYMLHRLRAAGFTARIVEAGGDVGGTWYWNRYPGARCDVESFDYCYSFDEGIMRDWVWTERYPAQPEIQRYLSFVADRLNLRRDIAFDTRVTAAAFADGRWQVQTDREDAFDAQFLILATGCLSAAKIPDIAGLADFQGQTLYTSDWPADADLAGKRVGIVGTGSSGVQATPILAEQAAHLFVFQRTPAFSVPANNAPLESDYVERRFGQDYPDYVRETRNSRQGVIFHSTGKSALEVDDAERRAAYERHWTMGGFNFSSTFVDLILDRRANDTAVAFAHEKIRARVNDPALAETLCPKTYPLGSKRLCVDTGYYETFNRDNVTLVDLQAEPLERITPTGIRTAQRDIALDAIVFATGFDAMTGAILRIDIAGKNGIRLADKWHAGPRTYLGLMTAGFPNLFVVAGPGSPSVLTNMVASIEQHVEWITACLEAMRAEGLTQIDADLAAEDRWVETVNAAAAPTLFMQANSWYLGANVPGKPRVFMPFVGGLPDYRAICDRSAAANYQGFVRS